MWHTSLLTRLSATPICGYLADDSPATEPTALAALALASYDEHASARRAADWLAATQAPNGAVPVRRQVDGPRWTTSLSVLAWHTVDAAAFAEPIERALAWMLSIRGKTMDRSSEIAHDPTLTAWPWVEGTHPWVEPTALHVLALKATGHTDHPRVREAIRMLLDRQILGGGCNYGNTGVLGQQLRPHIQPTGLALCALSGEARGAARVAASIAWLQAALAHGTTTVSLAWGLLGLQAHGDGRQPAIPANANQWLDEAQVRQHANGLSSFKAALLLLAATAVAGRDCPLSGGVRGGGRPLTANLPAMPEFANGEHGP